MDIRIISTIGTTEPITLAEAKNYLRINNTQDDDYITDLIINARKECERFLNSDILAKQRSIYFADLDDAINLPYAPIATVDTVVVDGVTLSSPDDFEVLGLDNPLVRITSGLSAFSRGGTRSINSAEKVQITYTTGGLPFPDIRQGVLANVAWKYYGRTAEMSTNYKNFLTPFKTFGYYGTR